MRTWRQTQLNNSSCADLARMCDLTCARGKVAWATSGLVVTRAPSSSLLWSACEHVSALLWKP